MLQVEIHIRDQMDEQWSDWFEGLTVTPSGTNETVLTGTVIDQTAMFGVLTRIRDLGIALISVKVIEDKPS